MVLVAVPRGSVSHDERKYQPAGLVVGNCSDPSLSHRRLLADETSPQLLRSKETCMTLLHVHHLCGVPMSGSNVLLKDADVCYLVRF